MATLSMFYGIIVKMNKERGGKHHRPHIHAMHAVLHQVVTAVPIDDTRVRVSFENGLSGIFDCAPYMQEKYWQCLATPSYFRQVKAEYGTLCWPNDIDVAPEDVWEECVFDDSPKQANLV